MSAPDWRIASHDREASLTPDGVTEASGPGWGGRFERMTFGPGFHMHLGRLDVAADSDVKVSGHGDLATHISAFAVVTGRATLAMSDWPDLDLAPGRAILFLPRERRAVFRLPGPQLLRFFSVALPRELLISLLDDKVPPSLAPLVEAAPRATVLRQHPLGPALHTLVADLGSPGDAGALQRLHREAVAIRLLSEMIEPERAGPASRLELTGREATAIRTARRRLLADLREAPTAAELATEAGMGLRRFLRAFEAAHGATPAHLLRAERLDLARRLLETGELSMKAIAWQIGYSHVSNFVAAFAGRYGHPPRRFQRQLGA